MRVNAFFYVKKALILDLCSTKLWAIVPWETFLAFKGVVTSETTFLTKLPTTILSVMIIHPTFVASNSVFRIAISHLSRGMMGFTFI
jgi:hypothetical protein